MNKNMKRVVSGLAALGIALSGMALGASSAYAATSTESYKDAKGTIKVINPNDDTTVHTLKGYQLGWLYDVTSKTTGELAGFQIDTNDDYVMTIEAALKEVKSTKDTSKSLYDLYADSTYFNTTKGNAAAPQDEANPLGWIAENIQGNQLTSWSGQDSTELRLLANALKAEFEKAGAPEKTADLQTGENTVGEGYYLLLDQFDDVATTAGAAASAKTAQPTQSIPILVTSTIPASVTTDNTEVTKDLGEVTLKSSAPSITKQVVDADGKAVTEPDYNIGDDIYYELTTTIPDYTSYAKCATYSADGADCRKLIVTDTAEEGLTIQDVESVKVGDTELADADCSDEIVPASTTYEAGDTENTATLTTIDLGKYVNSDAVANNYGATVTIIVKAKLNSKAKISTPNQLQENKNKVSLTYSNKYDNVQDAKTIEGGEVNVYTFKFQLKKTAMDGTTLLDGAKFKVQNENKKWLKYDSTKAEWGEADDQAGGDEFTSANGGMVTGLDGLKAGTYTVKETEPAPNYTTFGLPTFTVTIGAQYSPEPSTRPADHTGNWGDYELKTETVTPSNGDTRVTKATEGDDAVFTINVKNAKNLTELPMTGGAGLVAVIAVGVLLAGAGTAAAVRSRKSTSRAVRI